MCGHAQKNPWKPLNFQKIPNFRTQNPPASGFWQAFLGLFRGKMRQISSPKKRPFFGPFQSKMWQAFLGLFRGKMRQISKMG